MLIVIVDFIFHEQSVDPSFPQRLYPLHSKEQDQKTKSSNKRIYEKEIQFFFEFRIIKI